MEPKYEFFENCGTKFPKELHHVFDKETHPCPASCCVRKLGPYVVGSVYSLAGTEGAFDFISVPNGLGHVLVIFRRPVFFRRSSKGPAVGLDFQILQHFPVCCIHIYLISRKSCRKTAETFLIKLNLRLQINTFVVCFPTVMIDEGIAFTYACSNFCAKLDFGLGLPTNYRVYKRLEDAHDPFGTCMCIVLKHLTLLAEHVKGGVEDILPVRCKEFFTSLPPFFFIFTKQRYTRRASL